MNHEILLFPAQRHESTKPLRLSSQCWTRVLRAAMAFGGLDLERWNVSEARQFASALRFALDPPAPAQTSSPRFAVFPVSTQADPGLPLREPDVRPTVDAVVEMFEQAGGVVAERAPESALRALPGGSPIGAGAARKEPISKPAGKLQGLSASEVLGPSGR